MTAETYVYGGEQKPRLPAWPDLWQIITPEQFVRLWEMGFEVERACRAAVCCWFCKQPAHTGTMCKT
jgi:hypothetical protein